MWILIIITLVTHSNGGAQSAIDSGATFTAEKLCTQAKDKIATGGRAFSTGHVEIIAVCAQQR